MEILRSFSDVYVMATEESYGPAQLKLAEFYANGEWVEQSNTEAYAWVLQAERNGADAATLRAHLEELLTPEERDAIQSRLDQSADGPLASEEGEQ